MGTTSGPAIANAVYDFVIYLLPAIGKLPRTFRHTLGAHLETHLYLLLEGTITACYTRDRTVLLRNLNMRVEHIRYHLRVCKDLRFLSLQRHEVSMGQLHAIGMQLGGWIRQAHAKSQKTIT